MRRRARSKCRSASRRLWRVQRRRPAPRPGQASSEAWRSRGGFSQGRNGRKGESRFPLPALHLLLFFGGPTVVASSFHSRSPTPEGPSKRPREDPEAAIEGTADSRPAGEPPAPERAAQGGGEMVTARPGQALEDLPVAPTARLPRAAGLSGASLTSFCVRGVRQLLPHC